MIVYVCCRIKLHFLPWCYPLSSSVTGNHWQHRTAICFVKSPKRYKTKARSQQQEQNRVNGRKCYCGTERKTFLLWYTDATKHSSSIFISTCHHHQQHFLWTFLDLLTRLIVLCLMCAVHSWTCTIIAGNASCILLHASAWCSYTYSQHLPLAGSHTRLEWLPWNPPPTGVLIEGKKTI